mmetsp:Transcript_94231/g.236485  ORF Transcript_94231/g.236485 Transcript_94231/m.236485 type:complete len:203 (-) Transcript_94231:704-1312(-)
MLSWMLTKGISTTPVLVAPATFVARSSLESLGPFARPSCLAAAQFTTENMEPVSMMPTRGTIFDDDFANMGMPIMMPGKAMPGECMAPIREMPDEAALAAAPASLMRCSDRTLSRSMSYRSKNGKPSIPWMTVLNALSAICAWTNPLTVQSDNVPICIPPSKETSSNSMVLSIFRPNIPQVFGVMTTSSDKVVESRNRKGFS